MHKIIFLLALLIATPAMAQQPTLQNQVDSSVATVTGIMSSFRAAILQDQQQITILQSQVAQLQKENEGLKAKPAVPGSAK